MFTPSNCLHTFINVLVGLVSLGIDGAGCFLPFVVPKGHLCTQYYVVIVTEIGFGVRIPHAHVQVSHRRVVIAVGADMSP